MLPLRDARPLRRSPSVTWALLVACTLAFAAELAALVVGGETGLDILVHRFGLVPAGVVGALDGLRTGAGAVDPFALAGLVSHMFLHGGWLHLAGNALFLWIFGPAVEDRLGRAAFLGFYLVGGLAAGIGQLLTDPTSTDPMVGASGAISAVLGAYLVLYPRARIQSLVFLVFFYDLVAVPAVLVLGLWFALNVVDAFASIGVVEGVGAGVAFWAHVGGFVAGALLVLPLRLRQRDRAERAPATGSPAEPGGSAPGGSAPDATRPAPVTPHGAVVAAAAGADPPSLHPPPLPPPPPPPVAPPLDQPLGPPPPPRRA